MAKISVVDLDKQLRSKELAQVYLLSGAEAHLRRRAAAHIVATAKHLHEDIGDPHRIDAQSQGVGDFIEAAQGGSLFAQRQIVVASRCHSWKADDWKALGAYCENPSPDVVVIIDCDKVDLRGKGAKAVAKAAVHVECKPLYANQVPNWIRMECQRRGKPISQDGAALLAEAVGADLGAVDQAIEKLILFCGQARLINADAVEQVILETSQRNIFEFTEAVGSQARGHAMKLLERLLGSGESAVMLTAMLSRHWRILVQAHSMMSAGRVSEREAAAALKVHPFFVKAYLAQAKGFARNQLQSGFETLRDTDRALKRSRASHQSIMTNCVLRLMNAAA